jgi:glycine/D-amino acid oxidase-like deaminating enzyme
MKNRVYWLENLSESEASSIPVDNLSETCDVAVIGGGLTGLSTAFHLACRGVSVSILENNSIGSGASIRNAGMTLTGFKLSPDELLYRYGKEHAARLYRTSLEAIDFAEKFIQDQGIHCDFFRCGALWAAYAKRHYKGFDATQRLLKGTFSHETYTVASRDLKGELGSPFYCGGLVDPQSAGVNPVKLIRGLLKSALAAGVCIYEHTPVTAMTCRNRHYHLQTSRGAVRAEKVVIATNGYTPPFLGSLRRRVIPVVSYIIVTEALSPNIAQELIPHGRMVFDTKHLLYYFRLVEGNRLLFGGRVSFAKMSDRTAAEKLQHEMRAVFPQLKPFQIEYYWSGNVCFTFDQLPHLGRENGIYYALGYCGHGVAMSLYSGCNLAKMIMNESVDNPFQKLAFTPRFYYRKKPWFLPLAGAYYKIIDGFARRG